MWPSGYWLTNYWLTNYWPAGDVVGHAGRELEHHDWVADPVDADRNIPGAARVRTLAAEAGATVGSRTRVRVGAVAVSGRTPSTVRLG